jgi:hypothetical protein
LGDERLEEGAEIERSWSSVARDGVDGLPSGAAPVRVVVRYTVVGGEDGEALRERQAEAIGEVLVCLYSSVSQTACASPQG